MSKNVWLVIPDRPTPSKGSGRGEILWRPTGVARNFDWEGSKMEKSCNASLVTFFGDVTEKIITDFFKFDFVIISLKNHNLAKSRSFRSPKSNVPFKGLVT